MDDLDYLTDLKHMETEFGSSQRKKLLCNDTNKKFIYVCLNIFDNYENIELQDKEFEITENIMKKNKLGTALITICSDFPKIQNIVYKYINLCNKLENDSSEYVIDSNVITPLFKELGKENIYFNLLEEYEYGIYEKQLKKFQERKSNIMNFDDTIFNKKYSSTNNEEKKIYLNTIEKSNILKQYMQNENIKSFTIDYLTTYILEIREILNLINIYFDKNSNSIYSNLNSNERIFLHHTLSNASNDFIYPISKIEPKIKIKNEDFIYKRITIILNDGTKYVMNSAKKVKGANYHQENLNKFIEIYK